ncbi:MAG TPA: MBL fold metallo-hydrolase [Candidatus Limiplasma stercoravium]|nr:MBL fold metallo-hydrolase [Candidatus Limiplasma stercoravium]
MKLTFLGAAHEVTGSRFLLQACGKNVMVDYGMEQGVDLYQNAPLPLAESELDAVLLTHAHIDHSGYLPLLYKKGFRGPIFATEPTTDLCKIMLLDSAHIQESDAEWKTRKAQRRAQPPVEPLYTQEDALGAHGLFRPCAYGQRVEVCPGISLRMVDVGHLLGSASIEVTICEDGAERIVVFSGDIGNLNQPLIRDPQYLQRADVLVMESTYGDRSHGPKPDYIASLTQVLQETFDRGGNVVIPSFAVGRTQEMLYFLRQIKQERRVRGHDGFPVYIDSPLGIEATQVFNENTWECADAETLALLRQGVNPLTFDGLRVAQTAEDSKRINTDTTPKVILSSSGMCDAGRIRHHLKHNLWRAECTVLFVGYQSVGTLGRSLVDGVKEVKLFGETIRVNARIEQLAGKSGHADNAGLIRWAAAFSPKPEHVFVVHGDDDVTDAFAARLNQELGLAASAPYNGECWNLCPLEKLAEGNRERLQKPHRDAAAMDALPQRTPPAPAKAPKPADHTTAYGQLVLAGEKLMALIGRMEKRSSKDQARLTRHIHTLVRKFARR